MLTSQLEYYWNGSLHDLQSFVEVDLDLNGKWSSSGGGYKLFKNAKVSFKWQGPSKKKLVIVSDHENYLINAFKKHAACGGDSTKHVEVEANRDITPQSICMNCSKSDLSIHELQLEVAMLSALLHKEQRNVATQSARITKLEVLIQSLIAEKMNKTIEVVSTKTCNDELVRENETIKRVERSKQDKQDKGEAVKLKEISRGLNIHYPQVIVDTIDDQNISNRNTIDEKNIGNEENAHEITFVQTSLGIVEASSVNSLSYNSSIAIGGQQVSDEVINNSLNKEDAFHSAKNISVVEPSICIITDDIRQKTPPGAVSRVINNNSSQIDAPTTYRQQPIPVRITRRKYTKNFRGKSYLGPSKKGKSRTKDGSRSNVACQEQKETRNRNGMINEEGFCGESWGRDKISFFNFYY